MHMARICLHAACAVAYCAAHDLLVSIICSHQGMTGLTSQLTLWTHQVSLLLKNALMLDCLTVVQMLTISVIGLAEVVIWDSQLCVRLWHLHRTSVFHPPHAGLGLFNHH